MLKISVKQKMMGLGLCFVFIISGCESEKTNYQRPVELRGVYLDIGDRKIFETPRSVAEAMHFLGERHFNVVFPLFQIDAGMIHKTDIMDGFIGKPADSMAVNRDPLAELIYEAHRQGLKVIPRVEYGAVGTVEESRALVSGYYSRWTVQDTAGNVLQADGCEWVNLYHPEVQDLIIELFRTLINDYNVDGIQGGARLFSQPVRGGYSDFTRQLYAGEHDSAAPPDNFRDSDWRKWRNDQINRFARRLYKQLKAVKPNMLICWSVNSYDGDDGERLQEWPQWVNGGYADIVIPLIKQQEIVQYEKVLSAQQPDSIGLFRYRERVFPGMLIKNGDNVIPVGYLLKGLEYNRRMGYQGEALCCFAGLRENDDQLSGALRKTYYLRPAKLPF